MDCELPISLHALDETAHDVAHLAAALEIAGDRVRRVDAVEEGVVVEVVGGDADDIERGVTRRRRCGSSCYVQLLQRPPAPGRAHLAIDHLVRRAVNPGGRALCDVRQLHGPLRLLHLVVPAGMIGAEVLQISTPAS